MTLSRILAILALIGSLASASASALDLINPKYGAGAAALGATIAALTERIQGGMSTKQRS